MFVRARSIRQHHRLKPSSALRVAAHQTPVHRCAMPQPPVAFMCLTIIGCLVRSKSCPRGLMEIAWRMVCLTRSSSAGLARSVRRKSVENSWPTHSGERQVPDARQGAQLFEQPDHVVPHQRLAAGDPQLGDAEPAEAAPQAGDFLQRQHLRSRQEGHILGHAVDAAQVAAIGDRQTHIGDMPAETVDELWFFRHGVQRFLRWRGYEGSAGSGPCGGNGLRGNGNRGARPASQICPDCRASCPARAPRLFRGALMSPANRRCPTSASDHS